MSFCDFVPNDPSCQVEPEPTPEPSVAPSVGGALANPYSFVGVDWHWTLWVAFFNVALPSAAYYQMGYNDTTATTARKTALEYLAAMHVGIWAPLLVLAILPGMIPAAYLQYISSNANPMAYLAGAAILANLWYNEKDTTSKWMFWIYFAFA